MTPQNFILANKHVGDPKAAGEIKALPIFNDGKRSLSSWRMSWRERFSALIFGRAWLWIQSGESMPPASVEISRDPLKALAEQKEKKK